MSAGPMRALGALLLAAALSAAAQTGKPAEDHSAHHGPAAAAPQGEPLVSGEVRRVDKGAKKLTIRHGAIPNLDMSPMTMVFQVADPAMLETLKAGDRIRFSAAKQGGAYVVTRIEAGQ